MRGLLVMLTCGLGLGLFWRRLRRRPPVESFEPDPAAELRAKLEASKLAAEPGPAEPIDSTEPSEPSELPHDPAARRRAVHDRARGAIDELG